MIYRSLLALFASLAFCVLPAHGAKDTLLTGRVVGISDGDTLTLLVERQTYRIRLSSIDAPETGRGNRPGQPYAQQAKAALSSMVHGQQVQAECAQRDQYDRYVCVIRKDGANVNLQMVDQGWAWAYRRFVRSPQYLEAESRARQERRGLWQDAQPVEPWRWRQSK